jgi:quercetin dioxygenase-like cupin family protein
MDASIIGPIAARRFVIEKKCEVNEQHEHNYDHATIVCRGAIKVVTNEGASRRYECGEAVSIPAGKKHGIKALEDNTVYLCVFSHRDFDGLVTEKYIGNQKAAQ